MQGTSLVTSNPIQSTCTCTCNLHLTTIIDHTCNQFLVNSKWHNLAHCGSNQVIPEPNNFLLKGLGHSNDTGHYIFPSLELNPSWGFLFQVQVYSVVTVAVTAGCNTLLQSFISVGSEKYKLVHPVLYCSLVYCKVDQQSIIFSWCSASYNTAVTAVHYTALILLNQTLVSSIAAVQVLAFILP